MSKNFSAQKKSEPLIILRNYRLYKNAVEKNSHCHYNIFISSDSSNWTKIYYKCKYRNLLRFADLCHVIN